MNYVATNGSDTSGNGSLMMPWATIEHALGADVVDAFYLVGDWSGAAERAEVERAVLADDFA